MMVTSGDTRAAEIPVTPGKDWHPVSAPFQGSGERAALAFTYEGKGSVDFLEFELS